MPALPLELLIPAGLSFVLLLAAEALQRLVRIESHPWHPFLNYARICKYVLSWYMISIGFTLCNKWIFRYWRGSGFPYPLLVTSVHMITKVFLTRLVDRCRRAEHRVRPLPWSLYWKGPVSIGICTGLDISFSNLSFLFISVTFYTILKSGAILWILVWAVIMRLEPLTWEIVSICAAVSFGVGLASYGETAFNSAGFVLVTLACASSGLRWALTQLMLEGELNGRDDSMYRSALIGQLSSGRSDVDGTGGNADSDCNIQGRSDPRDCGRHRCNTARDPPLVDHAHTPVNGSEAHSVSVQHPQAFEILYHLTPASAIICVAAFLVVEWKSCVQSHVFKDLALLFQLLAILLVGGLISFLLVLTEVKLVKISSSLTMSMFGALKEVITVAISMVVFHDDVSLLNVFGLFVAILGAICYKRYKEKVSSAGSSNVAFGRNHGGREQLQRCSACLPTTSRASSIEDDSSEDGEEILQAVGGRGMDREMEMFNFNHAELA
ncbi:solute carrier family 35 member c2 [Nannochloropsis gaditana]|uniref:Solute carrier family 35 member c2 n=1 Tax=Nannochloropsis gaditana TaxID=72520 RepID=W7TSN0_9STRA|nr:solute carrier family 35 member c2 [Nannochloropsis gaditana]